MDIAAKIKHYRENMGITKSELARKLSVSPAMITFYEKGKRQPSLKVLQQIAGNIRVPIEYFFSDKEYTFQVVSRGKGRISKQENEEVARFQIIVDNFLNIANVFNLDLDYSGPTKYFDEEVSDQAIGYIKSSLRLPDILDYESLSEALWKYWKIPVFRIPFQAKNLSGLTIKQGNAFFIFINKGHCIERNFFSLAHELGHILMHLEDNGFIVSRLSSRDPLEKQANDFAGRFIVPPISLKTKLDNETLLHNRDNIRSLAKAFNTSYECIVYNLVKMSIISYTNPVSKPGKQVNLNYDTKWTFKDLPGIYNMCVYYAWLKGEISISKAASYLFSDIQTISEYFKTINEERDGDSIG